MPLSVPWGFALLGAPCARSLARSGLISCLRALAPPLAPPPQSATLSYTYAESVQITNAFTTTDTVR